MTDSKQYIQYKDVAKFFGAQRVYENFYLDIKRGETLCLIGPSGVGKTVLMKMLIGLVIPDDGQVIFDSIVLTDFTKDEDFLPIRKRIAMVFQGSALFDSMTVYDNVAYALREQMWQDMSENEIRDKVAEKLEWVGLPGTGDMMPEELSGGMKKRIGLARAIATDPEVILYDEPTAGLDPINTVRITELIMSLQNRLKCTSLVVTHDIPAANRLSNRAALIYDGHVRSIGTISELLASQDKYVRGFMTGDSTLVED